MKICHCHNINCEPCRERARMLKLLRARERIAQHAWNNARTERIAYEDDAQTGRKED